MEFEISYTNNEITSWGGMVILKRMLEKMGFREVIEQNPDLPDRGSNRGYQTSTIIESFYREHMVWSESIFAHGGVATRCGDGAENRIKALKYDFGFDSFNLKDFYATEAALTFAMIAYNLMSLFRTFLLQEKTKKNPLNLALQNFCNRCIF